MKIIDATDAILGRLATYVAKQALQGEKIIILNCANVVISGSKEDVLARYKHLRDIGGPFHGPFFPRMPDRIVKKAIKRMLPYRVQRGIEAIRRIKCYIKVPEEYAGKDAETVKQAELTRLKTDKYLRVGELSRLLGARW